MKRKIDIQLLEWKAKGNRKPLVVNGARQVGKTYSIKSFGNEHFERIVYINLEVQTYVNLFFDQHIHPKEVIPFIEANFGIQISHEDTLIVFDEIQSCPRALLSLKSFAEDAPEYYVAAAGSLLGVAINRDNISYPVGKIDEIILYPLDFEEFLWAQGKDFIADKIKENFHTNLEMNQSLHRLCFDLFKSYLIVGGMPACVSNFIANQNYSEVQEIHMQIISDYTADMAKYATGSLAVKIRACYDSIPVQLAKENKKFQYKIVQKGGTASIFGEAIDWLMYAGIALKCDKITHGYIPILAYRDFSDFKLYMSDIGLMTTKSGYPIQMILSDIDPNNTFKGALIENYVAQVLNSKGYKLLYWKNENTAECDFVIQNATEVIPIEVKSGHRTRSTSLSIFIKKYQAPNSIILSLKNFGFENSIKSVPLYATWCL